MDEDNKQFFSCGESFALTSTPMKNLDEIVKGLTGPILQLEELLQENTLEIYANSQRFFISYWNGMRDALVLPIEVQEKSTLQ